MSCCIRYITDNACSVYWRDMKLLMPTVFNGAANDEKLSLRRFLVTWSHCTKMRIFNSWNMKDFFHVIFVLNINFNNQTCLNKECLFFAYLQLALLFWGDFSYAPLEWMIVQKICHILHNWRVFLLCEFWYAPSECTALWTSCYSKYNCVFFLHEFSYAHWGCNAVHMTCRILNT
jgi:hypothetical protein